MTKEPDSRAWDIEVLVEVPAWNERLPDAATLVRGAAAATLTAEEAEGEKAVGAVCILLTDDASQRDLNRQFRGLDRPTNVLSFPAEDDFAPLEGVAAPPRLLGDLALALETCSREAEEQGKSLADHVAHLTVHGLLHLLGYDHQTDAEAERMEGRERRILEGLEIADPYLASSPEVAA